MSYTSCMCIVYIRLSVLIGPKLIRGEAKTLTILRSIYVNSSSVYLHSKEKTV